MTEEQEQAQPDPTTTEPTEPTRQPVTKTRLRDRVLGIRGIAAVALRRTRPRRPRRHRDRLRGRRRRRRPRTGPVRAAVRRRRGPPRTGRRLPPAGRAGPGAALDRARRGDPAGRVHRQLGEHQQLSEAGAPGKRVAGAAHRWERMAGVVHISYPPELPVTQRRDDIAAAIRDHQVVIVAGETGSGKTTQLPKICLELGRGKHAADRAHPAAPDRRPVGRRADRRGARHRPGRPGRLPGPVHRPHLEGEPAQADDRRHPAGRAAARPPAAEVRHDHHRRGPRAEPQHRLPARLPQAPAAEAARPQADHHLGDHRPRAVRPALRRPPRQARADHRGVRPDLPGRRPLPPAHRAPRGGRGGRGRRPRPDRGDRRRGQGALRRGARRRPRVPARRAGDPRHRRRARTTCRAPRSCRCTPGSPPPSSTGSSSPTPGAGSCSPPTSPRRR